jgi:NhaP-type Na+/H+ or K+/H+ antiporter
MGSFFYLAFALHETFFSLNQELWSVVAFVVILSILVHGLTATSVMQRLETQFVKRVKPELQIKNDNRSNNDKDKRPDKG